MWWPIEHVTTHSMLVAEIGYMRRPGCFIGWGHRRHFTCKRSTDLKKNPRSWYATDTRKSRFTKRTTRMQAVTRRTCKINHISRIQRAICELMSMILHNSWSRNWRKTAGRSEWRYQRHRRIQEFFWEGVKEPRRRAWNVGCVGEGYGDGVSPSSAD